MAGKLTREMLGKVDPSTLLEIVETVGHLLPENSIPVVFFDDPDAHCAKSESAHSDICDIVWEHLPDEQKEEAPPPELEEEIPPAAAASRPAPAKQEVKPQSAKGTSTAEAPAGSKRAFDDFQFSDGNPISRGSAHSAVFELLLQDKGVTVKEIKDVFEARGLFWKDYGVILHHFKRNRFRPKTFGPADHHVFARETGEVRDKKKAFRLYHEGEGKWLNKVPVSKWGFPPRVEVKTKKATRPKPVAKPKEAKSKKETKSGAEKTSSTKAPATSGSKSVKRKSDLKSRKKK